jgi:ribosomal protein S6
LGQIYEGMVLVDNDVVRADWRQAKALVTDTLTKYGATVHSARRWDERALAYPIAGRQRATYYLAYFELPEGNSEAMRRDFDLNERILRYLFTAVEELPEGEAALAAEEDGEEYVVPEPPQDPEPPSPFNEFEQEEAEEAAAESTEEAAAEGSEESSDEAKEGEAEAAPAADESAPAAEDAPAPAEETTEKADSGQEG